MDLSKLKKDIDAWFDSVEGKVSIEKMKRWGKRKEYYSDLVKKQIDEKPILLESFLIHEEKFQEMKYTKHHTQTSSRLFNMLFSIWREYGVMVGQDYMDDEYGFLGGSFDYLGYKMQVFVGQGSFYRVYKGEECIFQSK